MKGLRGHPKDLISFGPFSLVARERLLTKDGVPVPLGARTLDTLIALATRPNQALGKRELIAEIWPDVTVEEGSLRFHIAKLREALEDGKNGNRYIATLPGRGYSFVATVERSGDQSEIDLGLSNAPGAYFLPAPLKRRVGRSEEIEVLSEQLEKSRFVTIVGAGGIGKTTVAIAVAHELLDDFGGSVLFIDLGTLTDPGMVMTSLAAMVGLSVQSDDTTANLRAYLRDKKILLILDNCEHVIDAAAQLAATIFPAAPEVHILATSREPFVVEGEWVHRLAPLAVPAEDAELTAAVAMTFPAIQLFVEHAVAAGAHFELSDADAPIVANVCRKLDGIALAIELAAGRVAAYGLQQTAALLDQRLTLHWQGKRTAPPRQKSLNAMLDWSFSLLNQLERTVLCRLSVFSGHFTLEAAQAVTTDASLESVDVLSAIESLVAKSMVAVQLVEAGTRYRLLGATRAYLIELIRDDAEFAALSARHAKYYQEWLEKIAIAWPIMSSAAQRANYLADLNDVRAALEWCFSKNGSAGIGISLAAAAAPVFFAMSLLTECQRWSQCAILAFDNETVGGRWEMRLQAALGLSLMWTRGNSDAALAALNRSFAIAEEQGDVQNQIIVLSPLHVFNMRLGQFQTASQYAERVAALSRKIEDQTAFGLSHILSGFSRHFAGDLDRARRDLEEALLQGGDGFNPVELGNPALEKLKGDAMAAPVLALAWSAAPSALARTLWLQGHPNEALEQVNRTVRAAAEADHPVTLLVSLMYAISVLLLNGELDDAEMQIAQFILNAETHSLKSHVVLGRCFQAQLAIARGDAEAGTESLHRALTELHALRYEIFSTPFNISLAQGFAATGRVSQGIAVVEEAMRSVEKNGDHCYMPELLRLKAVLLFSEGHDADADAETCMKESIALSRRQGARAWELRASIDWAKHLAFLGHSREAFGLLMPVLGQFSDKSSNADLRAARALLASCG